MSREKIDLIYDALMNFREEMKEDIKEMKENAKAHAEEMHEHKVEVTGKLENMEKRVSTLEEPSKALGYIKTWAAWVITVGGAIGVAINYLGDK